MSALLGNLLRFGRVLREAGVDLPANRMLDAVRALGYIDIGRRSDFYFTLRALLVCRHQDLPIFDDAFLVFWRRPARPWSPDDLRALGERRRFGPQERERSSTAAGSSATQESQEHHLIQRIAPLSYSAREVSRTKDFASFTEAELEQAKLLVAELAWNPGQRRTRRWRSDRGPQLDPRRLLRQNLRYGAELFSLPTRARRVKRRPVVLLCDVSGSMERYVRMLLHFVHSLSSAPGRVEAFLFATRLTRITHDLQQRGADQAVRRILTGVPDWGGGTRIGDAIRTFNVQWARRVTEHGPIVLLISDGWDRGDPALLEAEIRRLRRTCHRLIWLNPLLGDARYRPLTRGMQAALPYIDDFLPVHNLDSLATLAKHLNSLPERRAAPLRHLGPPSGSGDARRGA